MRRRDLLKSLAGMPLIAGLVPSSTGKLSQCSPPMIGVDPAAPCGDRSAVWIYGPSGKWQMVGWTRSVEMKLVAPQVTAYRMGNVIPFGGTIS